MKQLYFTTELADGTVLESSTILPDFLLWETTAKKHGWSVVPSENPNRWESFLGWATLKRLGLYTGTYEAFTTGDVVNLDGSVEHSGADRDLAGRGIRKSVR